MKKFRSSLRGRSIAFTTILVSTILIASFLFMSVSEFNSLVSQTDERINIESRISTSIIDQYYGLGNIIELRRSLKTLSENMGYEYAVFRNNEGQVVWEYTRNNVAIARPYNNVIVVLLAKFLANDNVTRTEKDLISCQINLKFADGSLMGVFSWTFNVNKQVNAIASKLLILMLVFLLIALLMSLLIYVYSNNILKPMTEFINKVQREFILDRGESAAEYKAADISMANIFFDKITSEWKTAQEKLLEASKFAAVGQTTAMIAHDIRKPLTAMKSLLAVLPHKMNDEIFVRSMSRKVEDTINRTNLMLSDILEFSKDATSLEKKSFDPQGLITSALSDVFTADAYGRDKKLDVSIRYDLNSGNYLDVDNNRIVRVFTNIIGNAVEAMGGKGEILIRTEDVADESGQATALMHITIGNNGPAIPEDVQKKLFDPFFTKGKKGGTGLGLSICQKIVDMHGGKIWVESDGGKTEFIIELPASPGDLRVNEAELIHHSSEFKAFIEEEAQREDYGDSANTADFMKLHKKHGKAFELLIVDDEPLFRETVRMLLGQIPQVRDHIKVVECGNAEDALKLFETRQFDYVIADIDMGKMRMNGYEMAHQILDNHKHTRVLIHSNKRREEMDKNIRQIKSKNFMGFLPKPMKRGELLQFLAQKTFEVIKVKKEVPEKEPRKVLMLNDDDGLLFSFKLMLKSPDLKVLQATTVEEAKAQLRDNSVDVILSDINLGEGEPSGYDFLKHVRATDNKMPFYMISGYSYNEEEPKARENGATGYLQLPIDKKQLLEVIQ